MTSMPDFVPVLSSGGHKTPEDGACFMEMASYLAGEKWSDTPPCTDEQLARVMMTINDNVSDPVRGALAPLIPHVIGTRVPLSLETSQLYSDWYKHAYRTIIEEMNQSPGVSEWAQVHRHFRDGAYTITVSDLINAPQQFGGLAMILDHSALRHPDLVRNAVYLLGKIMIVTFREVFSFPGVSAEQTNTSHYEKLKALVG